MLRDTARRRTGTSAAYLTARLSRDRPDLLARLAAGEFRSVRAAALAAGFCPRTLTVELTPERAARALARHLDATQLLALYHELAQLLPDGGRERCSASGSP